jgi:uncharacterized membrane protein HdeD (DUF308 family)
LDTAVVLALLWGLWALVDGLVSLVEASRPARPAARLMLALMGLVALAAGLLAVSSPGLTAVTLTWILGIWLLCRGVLDATVAILDRGAESRIGLFLSGAVDVLLGLLFCLNPGRSVLTLAVTLGLAATVWGGVLLIAGFATRHREAAGSTAVRQRGV